MARGITAEQIESAVIDNYSGKQIPCYIGSAPIWQVDDANWASLAGQTFILSSLKDARSKIGYMVPDSGMFTKDISLCEAVTAHFATDNAVGPIIVLLNACTINVDEEEVTENVSISGGTGRLNVDGLAVLSSVTVKDKVKGTNYTVSYDDKGKSIIFNELNKSLGSTIEVTYNKVDTESIVMVSDTFKMLDFFEQTVGYVPNILAAPLWESELIGGTGTETVGSKLIEVSEGKLNKHWFTQCYIQLMSNSKDSVSSEKTSKNYNSPKLKVFWPYVSKGGLIFSLVTQYIVKKLAIDIKNDNVPYESASNEELDIDYICNSSGTRIWQNEKQADSLNEIGVTTCNFSAKSWRTWGICMSNYLESKKEEIKPEYLTDVAVQMRDYVCNDFQSKNIDYIDKPMPDRIVKQIADEYQTTLNELVGSGALLYGTIGYSAENTSATAENGDFIFDLKETSTPPGKSITVKVQYSRDGLVNYSAASEEGADE